MIHEDYTETYVEFSFSGRTYQYTTEAGGLTDLEVHLNQEPYTSVMFSLSVSDGTEARIESPSSLLFTTDNHNISQYILVQGLMDSDSGDMNFQVTCDPVPLEKVPYYDQFIPSSFQITNFDISTVPNELNESILIKKDYKTETGWIVNLQSQPLTQVMYTV